jgi:hypothetical protein
MHFVLDLPATIRTTDMGEIHREPPYPTVIPRHFRKGTARNFKRTFLPTPPGSLSVHERQAGHQLPPAQCAAKHHKPRPAGRQGAGSKRRQAVIQKILRHLKLAVDPPPIAPAQQAAFAWDFSSP